MTAQSFTQHRTLLVLGGVIALIWSLLGIVDRGNQPYNGYWTDGNNTVIRISRGSPAETAGLRVGDYITSIGGIASTDSKSNRERGRATIGETRIIVVQRDTSETSISLTYSGRPAKEMALGQFGSIIGLMFLSCGMLTYHLVDRKTAFLLAVVGVAFGYIIGGGYYFESGLLRRLNGVVIALLLLFGFTSLLQFSLEFPSRKSILEKPSMPRLLYYPAILFALFLIYLNLVQPDSTSGLNTLRRLLFGVFIVTYFGLTLLSFLQTYRNASSSDRRTHGLTLVVGGALIGLLPLTFGNLVGVFAPKVVLPGQEYYLLTMALVPITLMLGVLRSAASGDGADESGIAAAPTGGV